MNKKIIFWDWTGTLADESALDKAVCRTLEADLARKRGISLQEAANAYARVLKDLENSWQWHDYVMHSERFGIDWTHAQEANLHLLKVLPGAREVLGYARSRGYHNVLATNAAGPVIRLRIDHAGVGDLLDMIIGSNEAAALKEYGRHYRMGLEALSGDSQRSFAVGDNPVQDIRPARRMGMKTVFCAYGRHLTHYHSDHISHNHRQTEEADHTIHSLEEIMPIIREAE